MIHATSFGCKIVCDSNIFYLSNNINVCEVLILYRALCWAQEYIGEQDRCELCPPQAHIQYRS